MFVISILTLKMYRSMREMPHQESRIPATPGIPPEFRENHTAPRGKNTPKPDRKIHLLKGPRHPENPPKSGQGLPIPPPGNPDPPQICPRFAPYPQDRAEIPGFPPKSPPKSGISGPQKGPFWALFGPPRKPPNFPEFPRNFPGISPEFPPEFPGSPGIPKSTPRIFLTREKY